MRLEAVHSVDPSIKQWVIFNKPGMLPDEIPSEIRDVIHQAVDQNFVTTGKSEEIVPLLSGQKLVILVGCGEEGLSFRQRATLIRSALKTSMIAIRNPLAILPEEDTESAIASLVAGAMLGLYTWDRYRSRPADEPTYRDARLLVKTRHHETLRRESLIAASVNECRDIGNENADVADARYIENRVQTLVDGNPQCTLEVFGQDELEQHGFHLHLAVNRASPKPPRLLLVTYRGAGSDTPPLALVGKGITYDTGGLNLKRSGMDEMRMDMCGAAAVYGTLSAVCALKPKVNVLFALALAENAIGPQAYKPGDVVSSYSGKTVEIGNTDAEGRLVMADANSYIADTRNPAAIINIATLTGAVLIALGLEYTGLMSTDDDLATDLLNAASATDDRAWRLPIYPELQAHVKSEVADIRNTGLPKLAGTLSAGEFLRQFAQHQNPQLPWAHLDIAGSGMLDRELAYTEAGASGAGVRLLTRFLMNRS